MPLYEYECDACHQRFERIQKFSDPPADVCAKCGKGPVRRLVSSPAIQFKGSGWYITDYARKDSGGSKGTGETGEKEKTESKDKAGGTSSEKDTGAKKTESASDTKTKSDTKTNT